MDLENLVAALNQIRGILEERNPSGSLMHSVLQLIQGFQAELRGDIATFEEKINIQVTKISEGATETENIIRQMDVVVRANPNQLNLFTQEVVNQINDSEIKTSAAIRQALDYQSLQKDTLMSMLGRPPERTLSGIEFNPETLQAISQQLDRFVIKMAAEEGISPYAIQQALTNIRFIDKMENALQVEFDSEGHATFERAAKGLVGEGSILQKAIEKESQGSPNFGPAMEILFGPSGKLATAAEEIAGTANLEPALQGLEKKVETGINSALDEAGDAAKGHSSESLGKQIGEGARAFGTALTSVAMLSTSVKGLGEAWDKPLNSTQDYMNLFSAAGNTIMQGVQAFEAFANVTKIASAAQAVFNAVMAMNPIVLIIIAVIALIAAIVLVIVYWDEVKLAVLKAANFISIEIQKIGHFFVGVGHLAGQVWDWIVAKLYNAGVSIINFFIKIGVDIQNFFIGIINSILGLYNKLASSVIGQILGLKQAALIPQVDVATRLIPPKEVPKIDVHAAFTPAGDIKGGLEGAIAEQQGVIDRKKAEEAKKQGAQAPAAPGGMPGEGVVVPTGAPALPGPGAGAPGGLPRPALPGPGAPAAGAGGPIDQSVKVEGGITVNINAERLEANAAQLLSDEIIRRIQERLGALRAEQDFRSGTRTSAPA